jgi:hypothetical protein
VVPVVPVVRPGVVLPAMEVVHPQAVLRVVLRGVQPAVLPAVLPVVVQVQLVLLVAQPGALPVVQVQLVVLVVQVVVQWNLVQQLAQARRRRRRSEGARSISPASTCLQHCDAISVVTEFMVSTIIPPPPPSCLHLHHHASTHTLTFSRIRFQLQ